MTRGNHYSTPNHHREQLLMGWKAGAAGGDNDERAEERKITRERDDDGHNPTPSPAIAWGDFSF